MARLGSRQTHVRARVLALLLLSLLVSVLHGASSDGALTKKRRKRKSAASNHPTHHGDHVQVMVTDADGNEKNLDDDLRLACNTGDLDHVSDLLEIRREIESAEGLSRHPRDEYGNTPLHDVAHRGLFEVAELLLDASYDVNLKNHMGDQPLHMSAAAGHFEISKLLVGHGAQINGLTTWGMTPLWWAVSAGHMQLARFLLRHGADVATRTTANHTVLMEAARQGHHAMVRLLAAAGVDLGATEGLGETALHKAAAAGHIEVIRELLSVGLESGATNHAGETVLQVAQRSDQQRVISFLRDDNADKAPTSRSTVIDSNTGGQAGACPYGTQKPSARCGFLDPSAYINELQNGPGQVYSSMRRHPQLFDATAHMSGWPASWFAPGVSAALGLANRTARAKALGALLEQESEGVYSFQLFSADFAAMFLEEIEHYKASGLPVRRVNSMNRYGVIVNEIGIVLQRTVLQPIAHSVYPVEGSKFDKHHSFTVQYKPNEDLGLDLHTDDSDVTFNICLGKNFTNATLTLCGLGGTPTHRQFQQAYVHRVGRCLVHRGRHRHGADDIAVGERQNLVIWNTNLAYRGSSQFRQDQAFDRELAPPDLRCLSYTHDRDYPKYKVYPKDRTYRSAESRQEARRKAWCPPTTACYDGMDPAPVLSALRSRHEEL